MATPASDRPEVAMSVSRSRDVFPSLLSFPSDKSAHSMLLIFKEYRYQAPGERRILDLNSGVINNLRTGFSEIPSTETLGVNDLVSLSAIELPFPADLRDVDSLRVNPFEQGLIESAAGQLVAGAANSTLNTNLTVREIPEAIAQVAQYIQSLGSASASGAGGAIQSLMNTNLGSLSRDALYLLRSSLPGNIGRVADTIIGSAVNPRLALSFDGVDLKQHSFNWTLAPKNSLESDIIKNIILKLKQSSLPSYQTASATSFKAYLKYPSIVDIYLLGVNTEYFMKFKSCMIRNVSIDYASPGLVPILKGGKPAVIKLNLEFYEMDIHTANDYGVQETSAPGVSDDFSDPSFVGPR